VAVVIGLNRDQAGVKQFSPRHDNNVKPGGNLVAAENLANQALGSVSLDRSPEFPGRRDTQATRSPGAVSQNEQGGKSTLYTYSSLVNVLELRPAPDALPRAKTSGPARRPCYSLLTDRRLRPLARRLLRTRRPFFVAMRTRNPCARTRWRLFGWNVRFPFICSHPR
jgi:hypothetical protein